MLVLRNCSMRLGYLCEGLVGQLFLDCLGFKEKQGIGMIFNNLNFFVGGGRIKKIDGGGEFN
jgi:hypothetical protein